jgi:hypothetical protein
MRSMYMSTIHLHRTTTSTRDQFIAGLTDFGPGRERVLGRELVKSIRAIEERNGSPRAANFK